MRLKPLRTANAVAVLVAVAALTLAGVASASPPANDNFADREVLTDPLPIEVERSNVGATKEPGEFLLGASAPSGHSVWFEWEATAPGWTTVRGCSPDFQAVLGIYQGPSVSSLTAVVSGNASEGPAYCGGGTGGAFTFWAEAGESYLIAEDSSGFFLPEGAKPVLEGAFTLTIESTPPPPNDEFAAASPLLGTASEEPNGARPYFARARGYNWGATKETDEPEHGADPGGASVWYSWTAPESGTARIGACCFGPELVSVYEGDSVEALEPLVPVGAPPLGGYPVVAGTTYRIAVDGAYDGEAESPRMGSFDLSVFMELMPGPGYSIDPAPVPVLPAPPAAPAPPDLKAPRTRIAKRKVLHGKRRAIFHLAANEAGSRFRCKVDRRRFRSCGKRVVLRKLRPGRHVLRVYAIDAAGNRDRSPAVVRFRIKAGGKKKQARQSATHSRLRR